MLLWIIGDPIMSFRIVLLDHYRGQGSTLHLMKIGEARPSGVGMCVEFCSGRGSRSRSIQESTEADFAQLDCLINGQTNVMSLQTISEAPKCDCREVSRCLIGAFLSTSKALEKGLIAQLHLATDSGARRARKVYALDNW